MPYTQNKRQHNKYMNFAFALFGKNPTHFMTILYRPQDNTDEMHDLKHSNTHSYRLSSTNYIDHWGS